MKLFHLSENGEIDQFVPKRSKQIWGFKHYVWAISEEKYHNYLMPRDCPRICIGQKEAPILEGWVGSEKFNAKAHVFIPEKRQDAVAGCTLFQYQFDANNFFEIDTIAGYYVSDKIEMPVDKFVIHNCLELLDQLNVNVQFLEVEKMKVLKELVVKSTNDFSIIKWANIDNELLI